MDEQCTRNNAVGDASTVLQAASVNAGTINFGHSAGRPPTPGAGSAEAPWGRRPMEVHGRDDLVQALVTRIRLGGGEVVLLHGGGGYGKTTIALACAHRVAGTVRVWWVDATSGTSLVEGLQEVALQAGAEPQAVTDAWTGRRSATDLLWQALGMVVETWLLVIDNADDSSGIAGPAGVVDGRGWVRTPQRGGTVMITSRDGRRDGWPGNVMRYPVHTLTDDDGAAMLLDLAPRAGTRSEASELALRLGGLPLALWLAGRYLASTSRTPVLPGWAPPRTFREYEIAWQDRAAEIPVPTDGAVLSERESLGKTWELSLDLLTARGVVFARPVLRLLSCLATAPIPYAMLDAVTLVDFEPFSGIKAADLAGVLDSLVGIGLLDDQFDETADVPHAVRLHPVIRETSRRQPDMVSNADRYTAACLALLVRAMDSLEVDEPSSWPMWRALSRHCFVVVPTFFEDGLTDHRPAADALCLLADFYSVVGRRDDAEDWYRQVLRSRQRLLGADHPHTLATRENLARMLQERGALDDAETEFSEILEIRRRAAGLAAPGTLITRARLARLWHDRGMSAGAETEFLDVLDIMGRVLGQGHPDTLATRANLAYVLHDRGKLVDAETELRQILEIQRRFLEGSHPDTLTVRCNLAYVLLLCGDFDTAKAIYHDVVAARGEVLGPEHPYTLTTRAHIANLVHRCGDLAGARSLYDDVAAVETRVLGKDHPFTQIARSNLAQVLCDEGDPGRAESIFREIAAVRQRTLGPRHPDTLVSHAKIADMLRARGDFPAADALYRSILGTCEEVLEEGHSLLMMLRNAVAE